MSRPTRLVTLVKTSVTKRPGTKPQPQRPVKYANRKKYGPLPPEQLSSKLEMPLNFIWHAPSRARLGSRYRHEEHKLIEGFEDWAKHRAKSLAHSQHSQQLEKRNLNNHSLLVRHLSKDAARKALKVSKGKAD